MSAEYIRGIDACIERIKNRQAHYELYRDGVMMKTSPATFAVLDEVLIFLGVLRMRAVEQDVQDTLKDKL